MPNDNWTQTAILTNPGSTGDAESSMASIFSRLREPAPFIFHLGIKTNKSWTGESNIDRLLISTRRRAIKLKSLTTIIKWYAKTRSEFIYPDICIRIYIVCCVQTTVTAGWGRSMQRRTRTVSALPEWRRFGSVFGWANYGARILGSISDMLADISGKDRALISWNQKETSTKDALYALCSFFAAWIWCWFQLKAQDQSGDVGPI